MKAFLTSLIILFALPITTFAQLESAKDKSGKFGFMNNSGAWAIQPGYDEVTEFEEHPFTLVKKNGNWGLINQQGETIIPFQYNKVDQGWSYSTAISVVEQNGKFGIVNRETGKEIVTCKYDAAIEFNDTYIPELNVTAVVFQDKKMGLIVESGREVVPCLYDADKDPFTLLDAENLLYTVRREKKMGAIDTTGAEVIKCNYDQIEAQDAEFFDIVINKKHGLYSLKEKREIISPLYDQPFMFEGEFAIVQQNKKYGAIDKTGKVIVPFRFSNDDSVFLELEKLREQK